MHQKLNYKQLHKKKLSVYRQGRNGESVVFLHGFLASAKYWRWPQWYLRKTHQTIALDLLGFGRSPKPAQAAYDYRDHLGAIKATLAQEMTANSPFALVGHSMGALLALRYATLYPENITRLYLFNPPLRI